MRQFKVGDIVSSRTIMFHFKNLHVVEYVNKDGTINVRHINSGNLSTRVEQEVIKLTSIFLTKLEIELI